MTYGYDQKTGHACCTECQTLGGRKLQVPSFMLDESRQKWLLSTHKR